MEELLAGKTVRLRNEQGEIILPRTKAENVHMADGSTIKEAIELLDEKIDNVEAGNVDLTGLATEAFVEEKVGALDTEMKDMIAELLEKVATLEAKVNQLESEHANLLELNVPEQE